MEELQLSRVGQGQLWYLPGGPGRQCPPGFEPGVLQFAGAVPALVALRGGEAAAL